MNSAQFHLEFAPFSVSESVRSTVMHHQREADAKGITMEVDTPSGLPSALLGDANRIDQILTNLLSNGELSHYIRFVFPHVNPIFHVKALKFASSRIIVNVTARAQTVGPAHQISSTPHPESHVAQAGGESTPPANNPSNTGLTTVLHAAIRIYQGLFHGICESSRVIPLNDVSAELRGESADLLPFKCEPGKSVLHVINLPTTYVAEQIVIIVCFAVTDDGVGLQPDDLAQLFKPFSQVWMSHFF